jgi:hypothetical protein
MARKSSKNHGLMGIYGNINSINGGFSRPFLIPGGEL